MTVGLFEKHKELLQALWGGNTVGRPKIMEEAGMTIASLINEIERLEKRNSILEKRSSDSQWDLDYYREQERNTSDGWM